MSACTKVAYQSPAGSVIVSALTKQVLTVTNQLVALPQWGGELEPMTATQGGWRDWSPWSGPTHRQDAVDLTPYNWRNRFHWLDLLGLVPFHRTPAQGDWPEHVHVITDGLGCVDPYAQGQIASAKRNRNGLSGDGPDPDKTRRSGLWPLAVYQGRTGVLVATTKTHLYDGPADKRAIVADAPKGTRVKALMEVNHAGNRWFVTNQGQFGVSSKWVKP